MSLKWEPILPMEPVLGVDVPTTDEWTHQVKWDGVRCLVYNDGTSTRLYNRRANERTAHYPELVLTKSYCGASSVILDGEIIALGADGRPDFHEVMRRDGLRRLDRVRDVQKYVPITYMVFDLVYYNGKWIHHLCLSERQEILARIILPCASVQIVENVADGEALFAATRGYGLEGIVSKRLSAAYRVGAKTDAWVKVKHYRDLIAVVGGFTMRDGGLRALLLGMYDSAGLFHYIGHAGSGRLRQSEWADLERRLRTLVAASRPFVEKPEGASDAAWVSPVVAVKIQYAEWQAGHSIRQPSLHAVVDVPPQACVITPDLIR